MSASKANPIDLAHSANCGAGDVRTARSFACSPWLKVGSKIRFERGSFTRLNAQSRERERGGGEERERKRRRKNRDRGRERARKYYLQQHKKKECPTMWSFSIKC